MRRESSTVVVLVGEVTDRLLSRLAQSERHASEALAAWRAKTFELPDYYLVAARVTPQAPGPDLYLGPLRAVRARRVALAVTDPIGASGIGSGGLIASTSAAISSEAASGLGSSDDQVSRVIRSLRSLEAGPWWPPLDELLDAARRFYPGALAETQLGGQGAERLNRLVDLIGHRGQVAEVAVADPHVAMHLVPVSVSGRDFNQLAKSGRGPAGILG